MNALLEREPEIADSGPAPESSSARNWWTHNQHLLQAEFARLLALLECRAAPQAYGEDAPEGAEDTSDQAPAAIDRIAGIFELTLFERDLLLLAAGLELDPELAAWSSAHGAITLGHAFATLPDPHWSALTPARPLRHMRLLQVDPARGLMAAALRIDERILHYLAGTNLLDERLNQLAEAPRESLPLAPGVRVLLDKAFAALNEDAHADERTPALLLHGNDPNSQLGFAQAVAEELKRTLLVLRAEDLPAPGPELDTVLLLLERELHLLPAAVLLRCGAGPLTPAAHRLAERLPAPLLLASPDALRLERPARAFPVNKPPPAQQHALWRAAFRAQLEAPGELPAPNRQLRETLAELAGQFSFSPAEIVTLAMRHHTGRTPDPAALWQGCRAVARPQLEALAQRIDARATWADLVLPDRHMSALRQLAGQLHKRVEVHDGWGFGSPGARGLGVSALFAGDSGTGKTMAAEVLASELRLDLYRVDLSQVVSKYIGETEKNLRAVFDAADAGGVLLLFDEADALFGKRTEVRDSHDRYSNIEVGYLLQRLESYAGLAILTTNLKSSIDRAFQRRLRFILTFPFPDGAQREAIWRRVFPAKAPLAELDYARLAQLNMAGGNIRNIALSAAFLAADESLPEGETRAIGMRHLRTAALEEAAKIERPLSPAEMRGWL